MSCWKNAPRAGTAVRPRGRSLTDTRLVGLQRKWEDSAGYREPGNSALINHIHQPACIRPHLFFIPAGFVPTCWDTVALWILRHIVWEQNATLLESFWVYFAGHCKKSQLLWAAGVVRLTYLCDKLSLSLIWLRICQVTLIAPFPCYVFLCFSLSELSPLCQWISLSLSMRRPLELNAPSLSATGPPAGAVLTWQAIVFVQPGRNPWPQEGIKRA